MAKILSQAGISLADIYNVQGSIAGIDHLQSSELSLVHELGATVFSERILSVIHEVTPGDIAQNTVWAARLTTLPRVVSRLVGITVCLIGAEAGRVSNAQVSIETLFGTTTPEREIPVWMHETTPDTEAVIIWSRNNAAAASYSFLRPHFNALPQLLVGTLSHFSAAMIEFRGLTTGFGAGTVEPILQLHVHYSAVREQALERTFGLPIPSW